MQSTAPPNGWVLKQFRNRKCHRKLPPKSNFG